MISCSQDALEAHESLAGTAPYATAWIVVEQPGPWGRDALTGSHLEPRVAAHLAAHKGTGVSVLLARHPDRPERAPHAARNVWVARSVPGGMLMRHGYMDSLAELLDWDLTSIGQGSLPAFGTITRDPVMFVCTHSGRDLCCALFGRSLITGLMEQLDDSAREGVWECSHIGGHRFAPVCVTLPSGLVHGRLDLASALEVRVAGLAGFADLDHLRGRSSLLPPGQVAAIEVQRRFGIREVDALDVLRVVDGQARAPRPPVSLVDGEDVVEVEVRHADGRAWRCTVESAPLERPRLESCGKEPIPGNAWTCLDLRATGDWQ